MLLVRKNLKAMHDAEFIFSSAPDDSGRRLRKMAGGLLNSDRPRDWLDELLLERITIPGQRYMDDHRLVIMGDSGLLVSVYVRILTGKRMEFNYNHAVLFAHQDNRSVVYDEKGNEYAEVCVDSNNANTSYSKERCVSGADAVDKYSNSFFDTLKYRRKPDSDIIQRCCEVLDYIDGKLQKASTIEGVYESGIEDKKLHIAWMESEARRSSRYGGETASQAYDDAVKLSPIRLIRGAGDDAPGCVCVFLDKKDQALEWIREIREFYHATTEDVHKRIRELEDAIQADRKDPSQIKYFKMPGDEKLIVHPYYTWPKKLLRLSLEEAYRNIGSHEEIAERIVRVLERAIQTNTVEEYFQHNYETNKAFIEEHYPFRLPNKWNAVVK